MVNRVTLLGNVGAPPKLDQTKNGKSVAKISLATTESYKDAQGQKTDETQWHNVTFYGRLAEVIGEYVTKGQQLYIVGKINNSSYEKDGEKKYYHEIIGLEMKMLGKPNGGSQNASEQSSNEEKPKSEKKQAPKNEPKQNMPPVNMQSFDGNDDDDDLPF